MTPLSDALAGLFSLAGLIAFLTGMLSTRVYYWLKCDWWNRRHPDEPPRYPQFKSLVILWSLIFIIMTFIGVEQQRLANYVIDCNRQFQTISKLRQVAGDETDEWSKVKTQAMGDWMKELLFPPNDMAERRAKDPKDPVYMQWALDITDHYYKIIDQAEREQDSSIAERKAHPLPEPSCGK